MSRVKNVSNGRKSKLILLILVQCFNQSFCSLNDFILGNEAESNKSDLVDAVNYVIENEFMERYSTVNVITAVEDPGDFHFIDFREEILLKNKGFCIFTLDTSRSIRNIQFMKKIYNIVLLDTFKSFQIFNDSISPDKFNFNGFFLLAFIDGRISETDEVFKTMWKKSIINVNAIFDYQSVVNMETFNPLKAGECWDTSATHLGEFRNGSFGPLMQIFPDKLRNLNGCALRTSTFERCPAVCKVRNESIIGYDIAILNMMKRQLNFTSQIRTFFGAEPWGQVYPNGSTTGVISKIVHNQSDIGMGNYILRPSRANIMDSSMVYHNFPLVFAIPMGEKLDPFEKLLRPFELTVWICLLITLSIGFFVILMVSFRFKRAKAFVFGAGNNSPVTNLLVGMFGGSQPKLPNRNFSRFLLMMFLLFCLVQRNAYQGSLYNFLKTDGRHKEVQTIDEMVEKGFDFYMFESYVDLIESQPKIYKRFESSENKFSMPVAKIFLFKDEN